MPKSTLTIMSLVLCFSLSHFACGQETTNPKNPFADANDLSPALKAKANPSKPSEMSKQFPLMLTPLPKEDDNGKLRKLLIDRHNAAVAEANGRIENFLSGRTSIAPVAEAAERVVKSALALKLEDSRQKRMLAEYVDMTKKLESYAKAMFEHGIATSQDMHLARYVRINAEIKKLRFSKKQKKSADQAKAKHETGTPQR